MPLVYCCFFSCSPTARGFMSINSRLSLLSSGSLSANSCRSLCVSDCLCSFTVPLSICTPHSLHCGGIGSFFGFGRGKALQFQQLRFDGCGAFFGCLSDFDIGLYYNLVFEIRSHEPTILNVADLWLLFLGLLLLL